MRSVAVWLAFACLTSPAISPALAESRIFIVANQPDGYGVDRCLSTGDKCGMPVARAYCQSRDFAQAASFRKIDRDEVTGAIPAETCYGAACGEYVAITCHR
jgi:hypothetical protein